MATSSIPGAASTDPSAAASSASNNTTVGPSPSELSTMFLKLLVTQLEHQDPTQPQDSSQMVTQLAQFASLEQLSGIHDGVTQLNELLQSVGLPPSTSQE